MTTTTKTTKPFYATWRDPIYCARIHWIVDNDLLRAVKTASEKARVIVDATKINENMAAVTFDRTSEGICILMPHFEDLPDDISNLAHELIHATNRILYDAGVRQKFGASANPNDNENSIDDEAFAYLFGWELTHAITAWRRKA